MAVAKIRTGIARSPFGSFPRPSFLLPKYECIFSKEGQFSSRRFVTSARLGNSGSNSDNGPFRSRLRTALRKTRIEWKPIRVALGIGFLGIVQCYRVREREKRRPEEDKNVTNKTEEEDNDRPRKRKRIRPSGPWYVNLLGLSRLRKALIVVDGNIGRYRSCRVYH